MDVAFKCFLIKSSSLIIDFMGAIELVDLIVVVIGVVESTSGAFVVSSSALTCNKSPMKLVKFDEIFLKPGTVVAVAVLVC